MTSPTPSLRTRHLTESFRFLAATEVACGLSRVCKTWRDAARQQELWKWFLYRDFPLGPVLNTNSLMTPKDAYRLSFRRQVRLYSFSLVSNSIHIYNLHYRQSTTHSFPPSIRVFTQQGWKVLQNGLLFVCGGTDLQSNVTSEVKTINTERWTVQYLPSLLKARASPAVGEFGDHIYVFGGIDVAKMTKSDRFDTGTRKWTALPSMPTPKHSFSVVLHKEKFWLLAVEGLYIEEFDPVSLKYRNLYIRVPNFTSVVAGIAYRGKVYYFGVDQNYCVDETNGIVDGSATCYESGFHMGYCSQITRYRDEVFILKNDYPVPRQVISFLVFPYGLVYNGILYSPEDCFLDKCPGSSSPSLNSK